MSFQKEVLGISPSANGWVRGGTNLEGRARFVFVNASRIKLNGKWRHGTTGDWNYNWNLTLNQNPAPTIRANLESRLRVTGSFCYQ
ncbi:MAG: hypothetical protein HRU09_19055 [Oligoflexales bacterium]|nr:hypothetical protein [Oligoflexales bacterium]